MITPGQTIGPFYGQALPYEGDNRLVPPGRADAIRVHGHVLDGAGTPVPDALIEIWQADAAGRIPQVGGSIRRDEWTFTGFGRCSTDRTGHYSFSTVLPGATEDGAAPFFAVTVFARGLLDRLFTRIYLPGHEGNASDPLLSALPEDERATLLATDDAQGLRFDIHLQGERETVFLTHG